jgi:hypothetical protein
MGKGSGFERQIAKQLSLWWSEAVEGTPREDIFWRSTTSGGRATCRAKQGKQTAGSYGDIAVVDPIGLPLLRVFTIELKRGRSHGHPEDLVDRGNGPAWKVQRPFEACLEQAIGAHQAAKSKYWLLICRRDKRNAMAYLPWDALRDLDIATPGPHARYSIDALLFGERERLYFVGLQLEDFLKALKIQQIQRWNRS